MEGLSPEDAESGESGRVRWRYPGILRGPWRWFAVAGGSRYQAGLGDGQQGAVLESVRSGYGETKNRIWTENHNLAPALPVPPAPGGNLGWYG